MSTSNSPDPMAEIRASFFLECEELLESLQDALGEMAEGADDLETVNVVFRAVHSMKGGAGAFGFTALVGFAHRFETVLDALRAGRMSITPEAVKLFFAAADLLQDFVRDARDGSGTPAGAEELLDALETLMGGAPQPEPEPEPTDFQPMALSFDFALDPEPARNRFALTFHPHPHLYASGNEVLLILQALERLGQVETSCDLSSVPDLPDLDPLRSVLRWQIRIETEAGETQLREVFDFVDDLCELRIDPTGAAEVTPPFLADPAPIATIDAASSASPEPATATPPATETAVSKPAGAQKSAPASEPASTTVRVDLERVDRLVNLVSELVINQAMLAQSIGAAGLASSTAVMQGLDAFMSLTRDIQDSVMAIRAQPVKPLFQRMARIVREASSATGKDVRLVTEGEGTEVDKTVIERLAEPLTHMIRNAVDHGLETTEARLAAGKSAQGQITLTARHRSGRVLIEIEDDGAGINRPKVREIAISKGLIPAEAQLTDSEIDNLLFLPGFSTASQVSALSGRGVGMDVVRQAIQALGGRISITSDRGRGTRFSISLPLTLAVLDGMVVEVAGETLVIPLAAILETAILAAADIRTISPGNHAVQMRGSFVPIYDVGAELGYRAPQASPAGAIILLTAQEDGSRSALIVDAILEQRQVVIKGLQPGLGRIRGVSAATILGDGQVALILDPADLAQAAVTRDRPDPLALAG